MPNRAWDRNPRSAVNALAALFLPEGVERDDLACLVGLGRGPALYRGERRNTAGLEALADLGRVHANGVVDRRIFGIVIDVLVGAAALLELDMELQAELGVWIGE